MKFTKWTPRVSQELIHPAKQVSTWAQFLSKINVLPRMNHAERRLVKCRRNLNAIRDFKIRTGVSLKIAHAEFKHVQARQERKTHV